MLSRQGNPPNFRNMEYIEAGVVSAIITIILTIGLYLLDDATASDYPMDIAFTVHIKRYWPLIVLIYILTFYLLVGAIKAPDGSSGEF